MQPTATQVVVEVDGIQPTASTKIKAGDSVLWTSRTKRLFRITSMECSEGHGPKQPFDKPFPNPDPPSDQVHSGRTAPGTGGCHYKYTIAFEHGPTIDPTVIIEQ